MLFDSLSRTLERDAVGRLTAITLEVGLVKACSVATLKPLGEVLDRMKSLETQIGAGGQARSEAVRERAAGYSPPAKSAVSAPMTAAGLSRRREIPGVRS